jgi:UPF0755 protein
VFVNRLRIACRCRPTRPSSTDSAPLRRQPEERDLLADTPYNTYLRTGLPPTPISIPGRASLLAAVRPEPTKALYFVSRGDGSSEFSETLAEHNRAVNRYQKRQGQ